MKSNKIINYSEVSMVLTGNKSTVRSNRENREFSGPIKELVDFVTEWVATNSKSKKAKLTIKIPENEQEKHT